MTNASATTSSLVAHRSSLDLDDLDLMAMSRKHPDEIIPNAELRAAIDRLMTEMPVPDAWIDQVLINHYGQLNPGELSQCRQSARHYISARINSEGMMPDDLTNWKQVERERLMIVAETDQLSAKIADINIQAQSIAKLTIDSGVCDSLLCLERDRVHGEINKALWSLRGLVHRQKRLERSMLELRREEIEALQRAVDSLDDPANKTPLKGGLD